MYIFFFALILMCVYRHVDEVTLKYKSDLRSPI